MITKKAKRQLGDPVSTPKRMTIAVLSQPKVRVKINLTDSDYDDAAKKQSLKQIKSEMRKIKTLLKDQYSLIAKKKHSTSD